MSYMDGRTDTPMDHSEQFHPRAAESEPDVSACLADGRLVVASPPLPASKDGEQLDLTPTELALLWEFAKRPDRCLSAQQINTSLLGLSGSDFYHAAAVNVARLRQKLGRDELGDPKTGVIRTMNTIGYIALSSMNEARIGIPAAGEAVHAFADNRIEVNLDRGIVRVDGRWRDTLSITEYALLAQLAEASPDGVTDESLLQALSLPVDEYSLHNLHVIIGRIRSKLGDEDLGHPEHGAIQRIKRIGYQAVQGLSTER